MENKTNIENEQKKLWQGQMQTLHEALSDNVEKMNRSRSEGLKEIHTIENNARKALNMEEKIIATAKMEWQDAQQKYDNTMRQYRDACQHIRQRKEKEIVDSKNRRCLEHQRIDNERAEIFRLFGVNAKEQYGYGRDNPEQR